MRAPSVSYLTNNRTCVLPLPGRGSFGLPRRFFNNSANHLASACLLLMAPARKTPCAFAIGCSPDLAARPTHVPSENLSSKSPIVTLVRGNLNSTVSPKPVSTPVVLRPFIFCSAVFPPLLISLRVMC